MLIRDILPPHCIACDVEAQSKKRALERLSELIARARPELVATGVFDSLIARERLGGTGIGCGVAIPHGRLRNSRATLGAFIRLKAGIDFDAADRQPVDLLFALLVPEESTEDHLRALARLAAMFRDEALRARLRAAATPDTLYRAVLDWDAAHPV